MPLPSVLYRKSGCSKSDVLSINCMNLFSRAA
jgi:hypothetical protein